MLMGRHSFKFGGQYHHRQFFTNTWNPMNGNAIFIGQITGFPMADALLGYPTEIRRGEGNTLTDGIGHFLLATSKTTGACQPNLTVNLGLMYQLGSRPYDSTDRLGNLWVHRDPSRNVCRRSDVGNHQSGDRPGNAAGATQPARTLRLWAALIAERLQRLGSARRHCLQAGSPRPSSAQALAFSTTPLLCRNSRTCASSGLSLSSRFSVRTAGACWTRRSPIRARAFSSTAEIGGGRRILTIARHTRCSGTFSSSVN